MSVPEPTDLTCKELVELVTDYLEGALGTGDRLDFEHHLVWCSWCRDYLDHMRRTIEITGRPDEAEPPSPLRDELMSAFKDWKRSRES